MNITQMSIMASVMIAAVVIIRATFMGKLPKWSFQALWGIVLMRLLIPFTIESPLSVYGAVSRAQIAMTPASSTAVNAASSGPIAVTTAVKPLQAVAETAPGSQAADVWFILWIAGAALLAATFLFTHLRARRLYRRASTVSVLRVMRFRVAVRTSSRVSAPLTYGVFRPVVLIPKHMSLNEKEFNYVLMHELAHIRHFDALKKWLLAIALCMHWFNPLVWVMYILAGRDIELLCDESVVRSFGRGARTSYATMLIDLMEQRSAPLIPLASYFSKNATEERIISIMKYKKISLASALLAILLVLTTATALATNAPSAALKPDNAVDNPQPIEEASAPLTLTAVSSEQSPVDAQEIIRQYAPYTQYALTYDVDTGRLYYKGELVRYFEDLYPLGNGMSSGSLSQHIDGTVDVHGVRVFPETIARNPDGSYDPSGELIGVEPYTQEEFDARTKELSAPAPVSDTSTYSYLDEEPMEATDADIAEEVEVEAHYSFSGLEIEPGEEVSLSSIEDIEWWTAGDYEAWLNVQREELPEKIGSKWYYQESDSWIFWTQEKVDETLTMYEQILKGIQNGLKVSRNEEVILWAETPEEIETVARTGVEISYTVAMGETNTTEATTEIVDVKVIGE